MRNYSSIDFIDSREREVSLHTVGWNTNAHGLASITTEMVREFFENRITSQGIMEFVFCISGFLISENIEHNVRKDRQRTINHLKIDIENYKKEI